MALKVDKKGEAPKWQVTTDTSSPFRGTLKLAIPIEEIGQQKDFDIYIEIGSSTGVEGNAKHCAMVDAIRIVID